MLRLQLFKTVSFLWNETQGIISELWWWSENYYYVFLFTAVSLVTFDESLDLQTRLRPKLQHNPDWVQFRPEPLPTTRNSANSIRPLISLTLLSLVSLVLRGWLVSLGSLGQWKRRNWWSCGVKGLRFIWHISAQPTSTFFSEKSSFLKRLASHSHGLKLTQLNNEGW